MNADFFFNPHTRTYLLILKRGEGREREGEKHRLVASRMPQLRSLKPRHVPWPGIEICNLSVYRIMFQPIEPHWTGLNVDFLILLVASEML